MTPLEINIMLHYYYSPDDFRNGDFSAPAVRCAIDRFKGELGLLTADTQENSSRYYKPTERGEVYIRALMELPLPVQTWVMPTAEQSK